MIEFHARVHSQRVALRDEARSMTYAQLDELANQFAAALSATGVGHGQRFGFLAANCFEYYAAYFGAGKAGAVIVPLNPRLAPPEWAYIVADAGTEVVLARGELVAAYDSVRDLRTVRHAVALDDGRGTPDSLLENWVSWASWLDAEPARPAQRPPVAADDPIVQMYTSGTTGRPKGAVLEHGALMASINQSSAVSPEGLTGCGHIVAPLAHIGSALSSLINLNAGGSVYVQEEFDMAEVVRILSEEGIERTMLVPAMIQALLVFVPDVAERTYPTLHQIGYGASPIAPEVLRQAIDVFGCEFMQGYGCTESSGGLTLLTNDDHQRALAGDEHLLTSAGRPAYGTEVRVVDEHGDDVAPHEIGEIIARGPQIMRGYWNLPEATAHALRDGWLHTGDAGTFDDEGYLYIKDRIKDMIVSGGENVYPAEVEQVLFEHEAVADAAVIGVPDDRWGEAVKACVVLKPDIDGAPDPEPTRADALTADLLAFCRERIAGYKAPKSVDFLAELPRNASMKVLKTELRAPYWSGLERDVS